MVPPYSQNGEAPILGEGEPDLLDCPRAIDVSQFELVACVNALYEVEDPEGFMAAVRSFIRRHAGGGIHLPEDAAEAANKPHEFVNTEVPT